MRFFLTALVLNIKRIGNGKTFCLSMALLPAILLIAAGFLSGGGPVVMIPAGIAFDSSDPYAHAVYTDLISNNEGGVVFEPFAADEQSIHAMEDQVQKGTLECGYILNNRFSENIKAGQFENIITLIKSPKTITDAIVNEMISAAVLRTGVTDISANEIVKALQPDDEAVREFIAERVAAYKGGDADNFVQADAGYETGAEPESDHHPHWGRRTVHGIIALFIVIATAFTLPKFIDEKKQGITKRLTGNNSVRCHLSLFTAIFIHNFILGLLSVTVISAVYPPGFAGVWTEAAALLFYTGAVSMTGLCLITLLKKSDLIYASILFAAVTIFCLGGIVFDLGEISGALSFVSALFFTGAYVNFILYSEIRYLGLLFLGFIVSLLGVLYFTIQRRKNDV